MGALRERDFPDASALATYLSIFITPFLFCTSSVLAAKINLENVKTRTIAVFYPELLSWEFMRGMDHLPTTRSLHHISADKCFN